MSPRALLSVAVVIAAVLSGCSLLENPTRDEDAVDTLEETVAAVDAVETYRYRSDVAVAAGRDRRDATMVGAVDVGAETMNATVTVEDESLETYLVGRTRYQQCPRPWGGWAADDIDHDGAWWRPTPIGTQLELFESGDLAVARTDRLDGREAVVLEGSPPPRSVGDGANGAVFNVGGPKVDSVSAVLWVDAETKLPLQVMIDMEMSEGDQTATATVTSRYRDYDEALAVELPAEATDDPRMSCPGR